MLGRRVLIDNDWQTIELKGCEATLKLHRADKPLRWSQQRLVLGTLVVVGDDQVRTRVTLCLHQVEHGAKPCLGDVGSRVIHDVALPLWVGCPDDAKVLTTTLVTSRINDRGQSAQLDLQPRGHVVTDNLVAVSDRATPSASLCDRGIGCGVCDSRDRNVVVQHGITVRGIERVNDRIPFDELDGMPVIITRQTVRAVDLDSGATGTRTIRQPDDRGTVAPDLSLNVQLQALAGIHDRTLESIREGAFVISRCGDSRTGDVEHTVEVFHRDFRLDVLTETGDGQGCVLSSGADTLMGTNLHREETLTTAHASGNTKTAQQHGALVDGILDLLKEMCILQDPVDDRQGCIT
ncbi:MAG: hypothetical protein AMS18_00040 [Gemmatimonas sp. SG8_17]|nr:MAG: hypothetical protein AMS18_00040 [Gemmatimonas sp. SG8_17]